MKQLSIISLIIISIATYSSGNQNALSKTSTATSAKTKNSKANADEQLMDTSKLKSDLNDIMSSVVSGNPDTTKLKNAGADILSTDAAVLSDSGIDKMYGSDPAAKQAAGMLKNWRNKMGITPDKLDSIKKAAAELKQNASH